MGKVMVSELHGFIIVELMKESAQAREAANLIDLAAKGNCWIDIGNAVSALTDAKTNKYVDQLIDYLKSKVSNSQESSK